MISLPEQVAAVKREIGQRNHVYPRLVAAGRMTQAKEADEIAAMEAVLATVEAAAEKGRLL